MFFSKQGCTDNVALSKMESSAWFMTMFLKHKLMKSVFNDKSSTLTNVLICNINNPSGLFNKGLLFLFSNISNEDPEEH